MKVLKIWKIQIIEMMMKNKIKLNNYEKQNQVEVILIGWVERTLCYEIEKNEMEKENSRDGICKVHRLMNSS